MNILTRTISRLGNEKLKIVTLQIIAIISESYLPVLQITLLGYLVNGLFRNALNVDQNMTILGLYLLTLLLPAFVSYFREKLMLKAKDNISLNFEKEILQKVSNAAILTRLSSNFNDRLGNIRISAGQIYIMLESIVDCLVLFLTCVFLLINLATTYWMLPIIVAIIVSIIFPLMKKAHRSYWNVVFSQSRETNIVNAMTGTIFSKPVFMELKIYGHFKWIKDSWLRLYRKLIAKRFRESIKYKAFLSLYSTFLRITPVLLILYLIALDISDIKTVVIFIGSLQVIIAKVTELIGKTSHLQNQLTEYLKADEFTIQSFPHNKRLDNETSDCEVISCSEVSFEYPDNAHLVLRDINISIPKGKIICIVGENGSGKTTLINILLGLYEPSSGKVTYTENGSATESSANKIFPEASSLFQNFLRLASDIRDNVAIGDLKNSNESEITRALIEAKAEFAINLGVHTSLDRDFGGRNLSGGEWQRIGLARSLLKRNGIVVLDEPTASLDPIAEIDIYSTLIDNYKNRTVILVSHRMTATILADVVLVLREGKIIEQGSHKELMKYEGVYNKMFNAQAAPYLHYYNSNHKD